LLDLLQEEALRTRAVSFYCFAEDFGWNLEKLPRRIVRLVISSNLLTTWLSQEA